MSDSPIRDNQDELLLVCWGLGGLLLVATTFTLPYAYYQFLRLAVTFGAAYAAFVWRQNGLRVRAMVAAAIVLIFNPVFPLEMEREQWAPIDLACAAFFGLLAYRKGRAITWRPSRELVIGSAGVLAFCAVTLVAIGIDRSTGSSDTVSNTTEVPVDNVWTTDTMISPRDSGFAATFDGEPGTNPGPVLTAGAEENTSTQLDEMLAPAAPSPEPLSRALQQRADEEPEVSNWFDNYVTAAP